MRYSFLASVAFAALIAAAPASFAFEIQHTTNNGNVGANFANNPDSQGDSMSANLAGRGNSSPVMHFGNSTLSVNGGNYGANNPYSVSPAYREEFMGGPGQIGNAISPR
jgi:hypothetical protein